MGEGALIVPAPEERLRKAIHDREELALVRRVLAGEEPAFDEFFERYFPRLYRFALARLSGDADAAEDVAQETLCRAMSKLQTFRAEAALFTWLCTFCRHELSALHRRRQRLGVEVELVEEAPEIRGALESLRDADRGDPEAWARRRELGRLVQVALDHLPARYASALEWKYVEGLTVREIAANFDLSEKATESLLTRARNAFRDGFSTLAGATSGPRPVTT